MRVKFYHQLLGTIVLVLLCIVLLPSLLNGQKQVYQHTHSAIPLQSATDQQNQSPSPLEQQQMINQLLPKQPPLGADKLIAEQQNVSTTPLKQQSPASQSVPPASISSPASSAQPAAKASTQQPAISRDKAAKNARASQQTRYTIQLVALKNQSQVQGLVAKLRLSGYDVYTVNSNGLTRIFVGPFNDRQSASNRLPALRQLTGLTGIVRIQ